MRRVASQLLGSSLLDLFGWLVVLPAARVLRRHGVAEAWICYRSRASDEEAFWLTCRGDYYDAVGDRSEAEASYRSAIALAESDGFPHAIFAGYLAKVGRLEESIDHYRTALDLGTGLGDDYERAIKDRVLDLSRRVVSPEDHGE